jgi:hypothetical protein
MPFDIVSEKFSIRKRLNAVRKFRGQFSPEQDIDIIERVMFRPNVSLPAKMFLVNVLGVIGTDEAFQVLMRIICREGEPGGLKFQAYKHMMRLNARLTRQAVGDGRPDGLPALRLVRATDVPGPNDPGYSGGILDSVLEVLVGALFDEIPEDEEDVKD